MCSLSQGRVDVSRYLTMGSQSSSVMQREGCSKLRTGVIGLAHVPTIQLSLLVRWWRNGVVDVCGDVHVLIRVERDVGRGVSGFEEWEGHIAAGIEVQTHWFRLYGCRQPPAVRCIS